MCNLFKHPVAKLVAHRVLVLAVFAMWADGGLRWFLPRYAGLALQQLQGLPVFIAVPVAACLGLMGGLIILATMHLPGDLLELAAHLVRRFNGPRRGT